MDLTCIFILDILLHLIFMLGLVYKRLSDKFSLFILDLFGHLIILIILVYLIYLFFMATM